MEAGTKVSYHLLASGGVPVLVTGKLGTGGKARDLAMKNGWTKLVSLSTNELIACIINVTTSNFEGAVQFLISAIQIQSFNDF